MATMTPGQILTPADVQAWVNAHGGPAPSAPQTPEGKIYQRAMDGSILTIQADPSGQQATVVEENTAVPLAPGVSPAHDPTLDAPDAPAASSTGSVATAPGGSAKSPEQLALEKRLAEIAPGGDTSKLKYTEAVETRQIKVTTPAGTPQPDGTTSLFPVTETKSVQVPTQTWYDPATGMTIKMERDPQTGAYTKTFDGIDKSQITNPAAGARTNVRIEGTPDPSKPGGFDNERPVKVTRDTNGNQISSEPLTASEVKDWREGRERSRNPGGKTDAEVAAATPASSRTPVKDHPGYYEVTTKDPTTNVTETHYEDASGARTQLPVDAKPVATNASEPLIVTRMPDGTLKTEKNPNYQGPQPKIESVTVGGKVYTKATTVDPATGAVTVKSYGPDGKPLDHIPSEGEATRGGPAMPTIVYGNTVEALTNYHNALYADPTLTPAERSKRFDEAVQVANAANNQAATEQREKEATRTNETNLATTRMADMSNGMQNALKFVGDLNGKLPPGSDLGAKAFVALLGINAIQMAQAGLNNVPGSRSVSGWPGTAPLPSSPATTTPPPKVDPTNPASVAAARAEIEAHPIFRPQPVVTPAELAAGRPAAPAPPRSTVPSGAPAADTPGGRPTGAAPPVAPAAAAPVAPAVAAPAAVPVYPPGIPADGGTERPQSPSNDPTTGQLPPGQAVVGDASAAPPTDLGWAQDGSQILDTPGGPIELDASGHKWQLDEQHRRVADLGMLPPNGGMPPEAEPPAPPPDAPAVAAPPPDPSPGPWTTAANAAGALPGAIWNAAGTVFGPAIRAGESLRNGPQPTQTAADPSGDPQGMAAPSQQFAVLQPPPPVQPPDMSNHPVLLMSRAQTTPPWQISEDEVNRMLAAGVDMKTIMSIPGRTA